MTEIPKMAGFFCVFSTAFRRLYKPPTSIIALLIRRLMK
jgi:hypothetical protein